MELGPIQMKWVKSLKDHPERQGQTFLARFKEDGTYTGCCLGEYIMVYNREMGYSNQITGERLQCPFSDKTTLLDEMTWRELGLNNEFGVMFNEDKSTFGMTFDGSFANCLASLNDCGMPWPQIAEVIENNPEKIFTKSL